DAARAAGGVRVGRVVRGARRSPAAPGRRRRRAPARAGAALPGFHDLDHLRADQHLHHAPARLSMSAPKIIAVAGNMRAGKSSLVDWLRHQFGMVPFFEPNEENPYLADFYGDMPRWAMSSQLFFLVQRFQIHRAVVRRAEEDVRPMVQDRTLYEDAEVFAA